MTQTHCALLSYWKGKLGDVKVPLGPWRLEPHVFTEREIEISNIGIQPCKITVIKYLSMDVKFKIAQLWLHWNGYYGTLMFYIEIRVLVAFWNLKTLEFVYELKASYK